MSRTFSFCSYFVKSDQKPWFNFIKCLLDVCFVLLFCPVSMENYIKHALIHAEREALFLMCLSIVMVNDVICLIFMSFATIFISVGGVLCCVN